MAQSRFSRRLGFLVILAALSFSMVLPAFALFDQDDTARGDQSLPIAENFSLTTNRDVAVSGTFSAVDPEGDPLTFRVTKNPARGAITFAEEGSARFTYTPYENKTGKDSFTYVAEDGEGNVSQPAVVSIKIQKPDTKVTYSDMAGNPAHKAAIALAERYDIVYAAVGLHPDNCAGADEADFAALEALAAHPKAVAIGEIGLDYYWKEVPRDLQKEVFRAQLQLAKVLDLPVIVHDREAHADCLAIVREFPGVRGVFHCYSGSAEDAKTLVKLGWHLSFTGTITFKNARKAPEVIAAVPLERIMVETDAPYMAPTPFRGKRCDSRYVYRMAETIAEIKGLTPAEVEQATTENGKALFAIP